MNAPRTMAELDAMLPELYGWAIGHTYAVAKRRRLLSRLEPGELRALTDEGILRAMQAYDGKATFKTYIQRQIEWRMIDYYREMKRLKRADCIGANQTDFVVQPEVFKEPDIDPDEFWRRVNAALTEKERRIVHWKFRRGLTNIQVGKRYGLCESGVTKVLTRHIRPKLLAALSDYAEVAA